MHLLTLPVWEIIISIDQQARFQWFSLKSVIISVTKDNFVHLKIDFDSYKVYKFPFFLNLDENMMHYIEQMEEAKFEIETIKIRKREAERREKIRVNALSKLSKEEKEILGL